MAKANGGKGERVTLDEMQKLAKGAGWLADTTDLSEWEVEDSGNLTGLAVHQPLEVSAPKEPSPLFGAGPLPSRIDWRDYQGGNYVARVKFQGSCSSCVAFAVVGAVEASVRIANGSPTMDVNFSEAHLFFCGCGMC